MSDFNPGDVIRLSARFAVDGTPTDPDVVRLRVKRHGEIGEVLYEFGQGPEIENPSAGEYFADIVPTEAGLHYYRWESEGMAQAAEEATFLVSTYFVTSTSP